MHLLLVFLFLAEMLFYCRAAVFSPKAFTDASPRQSMQIKIATLMANSSFWMLPLRNRQLSLNSLGDKARARVALNKLLNGEDFMYSTIGGSVTAGHGGSVRNPAWPLKLHQLLTNLFQPTTSP